jgi:hypothetical protein
METEAIKQTLLSIFAISKSRPDDEQLNKNQGNNILTDQKTVAQNSKFFRNWISNVFKFDLSNGRTRL